MLPSLATADASNITVGVWAEDRLHCLLSDQNFNGGRIQKVKWEVESVNLEFVTLEVLMPRSHAHNKNVAASDLVWSALDNMSCPPMLND